MHIPQQLVIMSATLDVTLFADYFPGSKILRVPGRQHPVEVRNLFLHFLWPPLNWAQGLSLQQMLYTYEPQKDYLEAAVIAVIQIHLIEADGDVLVFLNGQVGAGSGHTVWITHEWVALLPEWKVLTKWCLD